MRSEVDGSEGLVAAILGFLSDQDLLTLREIRSALRQEIDRAGPDALVTLRGRLAAESGWEYSPRDPLAQRIHHLLADRLLRDESALEASSHLARVSGAPVVIVANHLSYADANLIEILLHRSGAAALANRLTALAGLIGTEALFPVEGSTLCPARVALRLGQPIRADALTARGGGDRRLVMDAVGLAIADALPSGYRGVYADASLFPGAHRALLDARAAS
jgi:hypothetical protein